MNQKGKEKVLGSVVGCLYRHINEPNSNCSTYLHSLARLSPTCYRQVQTWAAPALQRRTITDNSRRRYGRPLEKTEGAFEWYQGVFWGFLGGCLFTVFAFSSSLGLIGSEPGKRIPYSILNPTEFSNVPTQQNLHRYFVTEAASKVASAVVNIVCVYHNKAGVPTERSSGSGFITHNDGTCITNSHVLRNPKQSESQLGTPEITVTLKDGRVYQGSIKYTDPLSDIGVLQIIFLMQINAPIELPVVSLGKSSNLKVGEWVVAIGSPFELLNSVTCGIVSCVDRKGVEMGLLGHKLGSYDYIQTDCAINQGNSGGPLINLDGEVVGVSSMRALGADGIGFAMPIDQVIDIIDQLDRYGRVKRPYIGLKMLQLQADIATQIQNMNPDFPRDVQRGILIPEVLPGTPAFKAGFKEGDVIIGYDGEKKDINIAGFIQRLSRHIGQPMEVIIRRKSEQWTLQVTPVELPTR